MIKKRPVPSRIINLAPFSQGQNTEAVDQRGPNLIMCKNPPTGSAFESMKGVWRAAEAWCPERPLAASVAAEDPGLKQSWRDVEAWHYVIRLE